ncbi:MAG: hypothetical protein AAF525_11140, partial [Pseudomonadota bacterium]
MSRTKSTLRRLFSPLLNVVEDEQQETYVYKRSHRTILINGENNRRSVDFVRDIDSFIHFATRR